VVEVKNKYQKGSIKYYRYARGFRAGSREEAPRESWKEYMEGYQQGKWIARPGSRWLKEKDA